MRAREEPLSTIQYVRTVRIVQFVIPANAGISGAALVMRSRVGPGMTCRWESWCGHANQPIQENLQPANDDRLSTVCSSESLVPAWSPVLIQVARRNHFSDSIGPDPDLPLQTRRSPGIGSEEVVVVFAQQARVHQRGGAGAFRHPGERRDPSRRWW